MLSVGRSSRFWEPSFQRNILQLKQNKVLSFNQTVGSPSSKLKWMYEIYGQILVCWDPPNSHLFWLLSVLLLPFCVCDETGGSTRPPYVYGGVPYIPYATSMLYMLCMVAELNSHYGSCGAGCPEGSRTWSPALWHGTTRIQANSNPHSFVCIC